MTVLLREAIGERLRQTRTDQRRTLREVSRSARVSLGYLSEVERGRKEPSSELLAAICDALALPLPQLLDNVASDIRGPERVLRDGVPAALRSPADTANRAVPTAEPTGADTTAPTADAAPAAMDRELVAVGDQSVPTDGDIIGADGDILVGADGEILVGGADSAVLADLIDPTLLGADLVDPTLIDPTLLDVDTDLLLPPGLTRRLTMAIADNRSGDRVFAA